MSKQKRRPKRQRPPASKRIGLMSDPEELKFARSRWEANALIEARDLFLKAVEKYPRNIPTLIDASRVSYALHEYESAERLVNQAHELASNDPQAMTLVGQTYRLQRNDQEAVRAFTSAAKMATPPATVHLELALLHERAGRLEIAQEHLGAERRVAPSVEAECLRGRILRRKGQPNDAIDCLAPIIKTSGASLATRARAASELAKAYDAQGRFDAAWSSVSQVKTELLKRAKPYRQQRDRWLPRLRKLVDEIDECFIETALARQSPVSHTWQPVLLTGMPRSGTTLLAERLSRQPGVACADELDVLGRFCWPVLIGPDSPENIDAAWLEQLEQQRFQNAHATYVQAMNSFVNRLGGCQLLLDKNPSLLPLALIYLLINPNSRLLVMLRDPRDVLISSMMAYMPLNQFSVDFLTVQDAANRIAFDLDLWWKLKEKLPASRWVEIDYQTVVQQETATLESLQDRLALPESPNPSGSKKTMQVNSQTYAEVSEPTYLRAVDRWKNYRQLLEPIEATLDPVLRKYQQLRPKDI